MKIVKPLLSYYVPGCISLGLLFVVCIGYLARHEKLSNRNVMEVTFPSPNDSFAQRFFPKRNMKSVIISDGQDKNRKFNYIETCIELLVDKEDTVNALEIVFDENATYGDFMRAINMCERKRLKAYWPSGNKLFCFGMKERMRAPIVESDADTSIRWVCG